ncbi:MAG: PadR family transcriptional regulator [Hyphomicrobiales bacterium]|nr:PadR family transcriptional regulator [Hyphomicrobiales bacterium]
MFGHRKMRRFGRDGFRGMRGEFCGEGRERMAWDGEEFGGRGFGGAIGKAFGRHGHRRGGRFFAQGGLRLVMLAMLAEQPRHGYEIIKAIEDRMGGAYVPSAGVVYPTLTLLEETGQIEVVQSEGAKKLYAITEAGRETLASNRAQIDQMMARMDEAGASRSGERDPRIVRAVENLRLALRLKLASSSFGEGETAALVALLDETASRIEKL